VQPFQGLVSPAWPIFFNIFTGTPWRDDKMPTVKRDSFRSGPKTIKRTPDAKGDHYPVKRFSRKPDDPREERSERSERRPRPGTKPYGHEKREWEPMHVLRRPSPPATSAMPETVRGIIAPGSNSQPVPTYKLKKGFDAAKAEITGMIDEIAGVLTVSAPMAHLWVSAPAAQQP
jgi:hypothetical protein